VRVIADVRFAARMELPYLLLGWLLGLLSPRIIDSIKAKYTRRALGSAIRSEAEDLQYRMSITSFLLAQRFGNVDREYLVWLKPRLIQYKGNEPVGSIRKFVQSLLDGSEDQLIAISRHMRAEEGMGLSLKRFSAYLVESSLGAIHGFPAEYQRRVHEFRNHLSVLNQEIDRAIEWHRMTFDSSISSENHERLMKDLNGKYTVIQGMCVRVSDRLQAMIEYDVKEI
jgi:hypothetical protein